MIVSRKPAAAPGRAETANAQHPFALMVAWIRFRANRSSAVAAVLTGCFLAVSSAAVVHAETASPAFRVIAFYNGKVEQGTPVLSPRRTAGLPRWPRNRALPTS